MTIPSKTARNGAANADVVPRYGFRPILGLATGLLIGLGACSSNARENAAAVLCGAEQSSGCQCADGSAPSATGCNAAPESTAGRVAAGAGATSTTPASAGAG